MTPASYRIVDNKKFMWDGAIYPDEAAAALAAGTYRQSRFDVHVLAEGGAWFVFTRREAAGDPAKS